LIEAERTINALGEKAQQNALVVRDARPAEVNVEVVVPGDILVLIPGTQVTAKARLLESRNLTVGESALNGESLPVIKKIESLASALPQDSCIHPRHY
jgi:Ca2+-transporting ATPase